MPPPTPEQLDYMQAHIHDDRRQYVIAIHSSFLVVGIISVVLRFVSRIKISARLAKDDWLILMALVAEAGHAIPCMVITKFGVGRHVSLISNGQGITIANLVAATCYSLTLMFTKLSILALYDRIFSLARGWMPTLWAIAVFVIALGLTQPFVYIFQCVPISATWEKDPQNYKCINFGLAIILLGVIHIITDWTLLFLPIPVVLGLQLRKRAKASICSLFAVGAVVCIISIIRLQRAHEVASTTDPTWDYVPIQALTTVEGAIGILAACMPTWRPLFRFLHQGVSNYFSSGSRPSKNAGSGFHRSGGSSHVNSNPNSKLPHSSVSSAGAASPNPAPHHGSGAAGHHLSPDDAATRTMGAGAGTTGSSKHVSWIPRSKRASSNTSDDSVERMLQGRVHGHHAAGVGGGGSGVVGLGLADDDVELDRLSGCASAASDEETAGLRGRRASSLDDEDVGTARRVEVVSGIGMGMGMGGGGEGVQRPLGVVVRGRR